MGESLSKRKNRIFLLLWLSVFLITIAGVLGTKQIFNSLGESAIEERDEQLFNLAYSLDNNLRHEYAEVEKELKEIAYHPWYEEYEMKYGKTKDISFIRAAFKDSGVELQDNVAAVALEDGDSVICVLGYYVGNRITFVEDPNPDHINICYDERNNYYIAISIDSKYSELTYHVLLSLNDFYKNIVPENLRISYWVVFADFNTGLALQNHDNQPAYMVKSKQEYKDREDGYSIILENEEIGSIGAQSYQYNNYEEKRVIQRIITLPVKETVNGHFTIGIAKDSESLYGMLREKRNRITLLNLVMIVLVALLLAFILYAYFEADALRRENAFLERENVYIEELADARIQTSTSQMQPHFLYNVLSSIRELILEEPEYAADLLYDFTWYLRSCIRSMSSKRLIPFSEELKNIASYVNIEKMRVGKGLVVEYQIEDEEFVVPTLSIEPLVENAIRHGIAKRRGKTGKVLVASKREAGCHVILVQDDGIGFDYDQVMAESVRGERDSTGLQNLILRLEKQIHGQVEIESVKGQGTLVTIRIPVDGE